MTSDSSRILNGAMVAVMAMLAGLPSTGSSQEGPLDPLRPAHVVRPATGGWYQPQSNFGNFNFDISDSGVAAGNWATFRNGQAVSYYFQGTIRYPDDVEIKRNGVIAVAESALIEVVVGNACLTCAYVPAQLALSGDRLRIEFTSSRSGRFILNDTTVIPVIAWMQGHPLFIERDFSGDWLAISRQDSVGMDGGTDHTEAIAHVRFDHLDGPEHYRTFTVPPLEPTASVPIPQQGARRYRYACVGPERACQVIQVSMLHVVDPSPCSECAQAAAFRMLWINPDETAQLGHAAVDGVDAYAIFGEVSPNDRVYVERDRMMLRWTLDNSESSRPGTREIIFERLPRGMFTESNAWAPLVREFGKE